MRIGLFLVAAVSTVLYFSQILILGALEPGYSHLRQVASELGMANAAHPHVFAAWVLIEAVMLLIAGWYFYERVNHLTARTKLARTTGLFVAFFGVNYLFVAIFPLPDLRHSGFGIGLLTFFVPWLLAWSFWNVPGARNTCYLQLIATPLLIVLILLQPGVVGFVTKSNLGLFQLIGATAFYGWLSLTSYWLDGQNAESPTSARPTPLTA